MSNTKQLEQLRDELRQESEVATPPKGEPVHVYYEDEETDLPDITIVDCLGARPIEYRLSVEPQGDWPSPDTEDEWYEDEWAPEPETCPDRELVGFRCPTCAEITSHPRCATCEPSSREAELHSRISKLEQVIAARAAAARNKRDYRRALAKELAKMGRRYTHGGFSTFIPQTDDQRVSAEWLQAWADDTAVRQNAPLVTIAGPPGTGKTHLLCAAVRRLAHRRAPVGYVARFEREADIRNTYLARCRKFKGDAYLAALCREPILVVDDFGGAPSERWADHLFAIIDARLVHSRPTIVTVNDTALATLPAKLTSRLMGGGKLISIVGQDRRLRLAV